MTLQPCLRKCIEGTRILMKTFIAALALSLSVFFYFYYALSIDYWLREFLRHVKVITVAKSLWMYFDFVLVICRFKKKNPRAFRLPCSLHSPFRYSSMPMSWLIIYFMALKHSHTQRCASVKHC